jgi:hypothetical protein
MSDRDHIGFPNSGSPSSVLLKNAAGYGGGLSVAKVAYKGWPNCYRVSNDTVELIVTGDVGPRIIRYGFLGGQNLFKEFAGQLGKSGEAEWQARGGHRLWISPEDRVKTYEPDNGSVTIRVLDDGVEATGPVGPLTGLEKRIAVKLAATGTGVEVTHEIRNAGKASYELAPWALTMLAQGGTGIHGFPPRGTHPDDLEAGNPLVMWPYTDFTDKRWGLLSKYLVLHQDPENPVGQKLGSYNRNTWAAYLLRGELYVKRVKADRPVSAYPDFGCSFETFTNGDFLEQETLGALVRLDAGRTVVHTEQWSLYGNVSVNDWTDAELDRVVGPLVRA